MGSSVLNLSSTPFIATQSKNVLADWQAATKAFYSGYTQLERYTNQLMNENQLNHYQATQLLEDMRQELNMLVNDLDSLSSIFDLRTHTTRLNTLINRATLIISSGTGHP